MPVPILKQGPILIASVQAALTDSDTERLRYDLMGPYHEAYNRTSFLNPLLPNPAAGGRLGALAFAGYGPGSCNCGNVRLSGGKSEVEQQGHGGHCVAGRADE